MFNDLDDAFRALRERTPQPPFEPASVVRRRGRRRAHRQIAVAGIAVVGVAVGAGALIAGPHAFGPAEQPSDASAPASGPASRPASGSSGPTRKNPRPSGPTEEDLGAVRAEFPDRLFLTVGDLPGMTYARDHPTATPMWPVMLMCQGFSDDWYSSLPLARVGRQYTFLPAAPNAANMGAGGPNATQSVRRYSADGAQKAIANVDAFQACRINRGDGDRELARDFGGDQSRLYVIPPFDPRSDLTRHLVFVRVGDRVTEVDLYGVADDTKALALATTIAGRLVSS